MDNLATAISEEGASEGLFRESGPLESRTHVNGTRQRRTGRTEQAPFQINYAAVNGNQIATLTLLDEMPQVDFKTSEDDSSALTKADLANRHSLAHSQNNTKQLEISVADEVQPESKSNLEISPTVNDHQILDEIQDTDQNATHQESHVEKKRGWFTETHNRCFALIYAIVLVSCGFFIYSSDSMMYPHYALAEGYNIYLIIMQMVFLIYIHIDTRQYIKRQSKERKKAKKEGSEDQNGVCHGAGAAPKQYGFTTGRYCGSLYLKIGAAVFCFGYMLQKGLEMIQNIFFITDEDSLLNECTNMTEVIMSVMRPLYVFYKLFFVFKYSNLIINRRIGLSRFGIMHCAGSSICFWIYNILRETAQSLHKLDSAGENDQANTTSTYQQVLSAESGERDWTMKYGCDGETTLTSILNRLTPYLFPFSIEFNIIMVGFWIILWENLGRMDRHNRIPFEESHNNDGESSERENSFASNLTIFADCHASLRGLFSGIFLFILTVLGTVLFFIFSANQETYMIGMQLNIFSELVLYILLLFSSIVAFYKLRKLDALSFNISHTDDILLFMCLPLIFFYEMATTISVKGDDRPAFIILNIMKIAQTVLQTVLICDGLRRCSNTPSLRNRKPGREFVIFMVITNISLWFLESFQIKNKEGHDYAYEYYGKTLWTLLSHFTLPFLLFFRFHSSACLADIWLDAYERDEKIH